MVPGFSRCRKRNRSVGNPLTSPGTTVEVPPERVSWFPASGAEKRRITNPELMKRDPEEGRAPDRRALNA